MPLPVDRQQSDRMTAQFDTAIKLVRNEFQGLDANDQYVNAFARLLKPDPLDRVLMLGTDQRDMFVPELKNAVAQSVPAGGSIFDFGAGNGQTFALVADDVPHGTRVSVEEPNPEYLAAYRRFLDEHPTIVRDTCVNASFDDMDELAERDGHAIPADGSVDLGLALQMLFFLQDLPAGLIRMLRFLKPGGTLFSVIADETNGFTGVVLKRFIERGGTTGSDQLHLNAIRERRRLLGCSSIGGGKIVAAAADEGMQVEVDAKLQPSRLYGHTLSDLIALANISVLSQVTDLSKFEHAADLLRESPESVDLRIETEGPRQGMWSVSQPQWVTTVRRVN